MSWRGERGGIEAAKQKHDVIMTPNTYLYFDYYQTKDTENEPLGIGGYLPLERVYSYEPMPTSLTPEEQKSSGLLPTRRTMKTSCLVCRN